MPDVATELLIYYITMRIFYGSSFFGLSTLDLEEV